MQNFTTEKQTITTGYNTKKKNMTVYETPPRMEMEYKTDIFEWYILETVMCFTNQVAQDFKRQKSSEMQERQMLSRLLSSHFKAERFLLFISIFQTSLKRKRSLCA